MRFRWPEGTSFRRLVLDVEQSCCDRCGCLLHVCGHRRHRIYTLQHPVELCCRVAHCSNPACPSRPHTLSPTGELALALPGWLIGWDVFCFIGHRRFARHWSVPQIRNELADTYQIRLSEDAISVYIRRYQCMVAARQQDPALLRLAYQKIDGLWLSIDGVQPEKGHETLYAVRELRAGRVWFAEALLSSNTDEVRRLLVRAREFAQQLGKPIRLWISDKQEAFVKGIALEFRGVPHRYCANHFLRDLAKPTLDRDSSAKVQMRKRVRGLRDIERDVPHRQADAQAEAKQGIASEGVQVDPVAPTQPGGPTGRRQPRLAGTPTVATPGRPATPSGEDSDAEVVLDYCCFVRGILNDDQGGPLHPPGLRMAEALAKVRQSLERNPRLNKPVRAHQQLEKLARCIDTGLAAVEREQKRIREEVKEIGEVAKTLDPQTGTLRQRKRRYNRLLRQYRSQDGEFYAHLAGMLDSWGAGLFVGVRGRQAAAAPQDNLDLERWFRLPKGHERRIHGHRHAGVRLVQEGPTLLLVLNAHETHPEPFTAQELLPYRHAQEPADQRQAIHRRKIMRAARSPKKGPLSLLS